MRSAYASPLLAFLVVIATLAGAGAASWERVAFDGAAQRMASGRVIASDRIEGDLAKPDGAGPFPAVVVLHGCAGMHESTKRRLVDRLAGQGYVVLLVDSYTTRGIEHACTTTALTTFYTRRQDAHGALLHLSRQSFVDAERIAVVGFAAGGWVALSMAEPRSTQTFLPASERRYRAAAAFYPPCKQALARPAIPTLIIAGALDEWTPAGDCADKIAIWGPAGSPVALDVHDGAHHGFYYPHLAPGAVMFGHWLAYDAAAAKAADRSLIEFLRRHLR